MKIFDLLSMCVRNLIRRKFRTFLTVMGVVIGTTSIVMMVSLGIGISNQLDEQLKSWGDLTIIDIYSGGESDVKLNAETLAQIQQIEGVDIATPFESFTVNSNDYHMLAGKGYRYKQSYPNICGVLPEAIEKLGYVIESGENLPQVKTKEIKVLFGGSVAYQYEDTRKKSNNMRSPWPDENGVIEPAFFDPPTSECKLVLPPTETDGTAKKIEFEVDVVGVLKNDDTNWETRYNIMMPLEDLNAIRDSFNKENGIKIPKDQKGVYNQVKVKALNIDVAASVEEAINNLGFQNTRSMGSRREEMQKQMQQMQIILGALGGISMLVSAISITNTMIMSVYERTREIGVMKVLGCLVGNIRSIFLVEAGFIGFFGGIIGIGLSYILSFVLNTYGGAIMSGGGMGMLGMLGGMGEGKVSVISFSLVLRGMAFATGIGLVSGFYPANRAVKISALEAIRQE